MSANNVLVVDDDDTIRALVAEALQMDGFAVATARNGAEALDIVKERQPGAIVLDLMMPVMSGWQFLEKCRALSRCANTPIVVMSAYSKLPDDPCQLGVDSCISKPFDLDTLLTTVERAMRRAV